MEIKPAIGAKATYDIGSDSYPMTVIEVSKSGHEIIVQYDSFEPDKDHDYYNDQKWKIIRDEKGRKCIFTRRKNGNYKPMGSNSGFLTIGIWNAYQDPSF